MSNDQTLIDLKEGRADVEHTLAEVNQEKYGREIPALNTLLTIKEEFQAASEADLELLEKTVLQHVAEILYVPTLESRFDMDMEAGEDTARTRHDTLRAILTRAANHYPHLHRGIEIYDTIYRRHHEYIELRDKYDLVFPFNR